MRLLTEDAFSAASIYLENHGRNIDIAWYNMHFKQMSFENGYAALSAYQCSDGGFGRALEPDHRTELSSCIATCVAFGWFEKLRISESDSMTRNALDFLKLSYHKEDGRWPALPKDANIDPHAIWWHFEEGENYCDAEKTWGLPSAEITGIMLKYDPGNELWEQCFDKAVNRIDEVSPSMEMNEAANYVRMLDYLSGEKKKTIQRKMTEVLDAIFEKDETKWTDYCAKPLMYITSPSSPFYNDFLELINKNLDWEIVMQTDEGCWNPSWQWFRDEKYWPQAENEWKSYLTAEKLVMLKKFGRIGS